MPNRPRSAAPPLALVAVSGLSLQFGGAVAKLLFPLVDPLGLVLVRTVFAAAFLLSMARGRLPGPLGRHGIPLVLAFGLSIAVLNSSLYGALTRVPLGVAVAVQLLGPLTLAVVGSRRPADLLWALLAVSGVGLLAVDAGGGLDPLGLALAVLSAAGWAAYIVLGRQISQRCPHEGLAWGMAVSAVLVAPLGMAATGGDGLLSPVVMAGGAAVAVLSSVVPYTLELTVLRNVPTHVFGVLMSLEPAIAAGFGLLLLGEVLALRELGGIICVSAASLGATVHRRRTRPAPITASDETNDADNGH